MSRLGDPTPPRRHPLTPSAANLRRVPRRRTTSQRRLQTILLARRPERTCRKNDNAHSARSRQRNRRPRQPLPRRTAAPTAIGEQTHSISQRTTGSNPWEPSPAVCLTNAFHPRQAVARALPAKRCSASDTAGSDAARGGVPALPLFSGAAERGVGCKRQLGSLLLSSAPPQPTSVPKPKGRAPPPAHHHRLTSLPQLTHQATTAPPPQLTSLNASPIDDPGDHTTRRALLSPSASVLRRRS